MIKCDYCEVEVERRVFCKPSHKVMFHRRGAPELKKEVEDLYGDDKFIEAAKLKAKIDNTRINQYLEEKKI